MSKIWVLGEALIDFVQRDSGADAPFHPVNGGSPFNAAKAARRQGCDVGFLGALSKDMFGERLWSELDAEGVDTTATARLDNPTMLAFVQLENGEPRYAFYSEGTAARMVNPTTQLAAGDILHVGSLGLVDQPGADNTERYALEQSKQALLSIDPNARPVVTHDPADWRERVMRLINVAGVVKLSDEDLAELAPGRGFDSFADEILELGVGLVVMTKGPDGAIGRTQSARATVAGHQIDIVDAVGAGDTVTGTLLAQLAAKGLTDKAAISALDEAEIAELLTFSMGAAAVNCTRAGCNPPTPEETRAFLGL